MKVEYAHAISNFKVCRQPSIARFICPKSVGDSSKHVIAQLQEEIAQYNAKLDDELKTHSKTFDKVRQRQLLLWPPRGAAQGGRASR